MAILSGVSDVNSEQQQREDDSVADALVIKHGWVNGGNVSPSPLIVMASESGVVFARSDNMRLGVVLTKAAWQMVVEFVSGQIKPEGNWQPDWAGVPKRYAYAAIDHDGSTWGYEGKPMLMPDGRWEADGDVWRMRSSDNDDVNFRRSVVARPKA